MEELFSSCCPAAAAAAALNTCQAWFRDVIEGK